MATRLDYRKLLIEEVRDLSENEAEKLYQTVIAAKEQLQEEDGEGFATDCLGETEMAALGAW